MVDKRRAIGRDTLKVIIKRICRRINIRSEELR